MLTDLEAVFRSLKSELGLRPIYHQIEKRVNGHIFITLLAYHVVQTLRTQLKAQNIHDSWQTLRAKMENQQRVTVVMNLPTAKPIKCATGLRFAAVGNLRINRSVTAATILKQRRWKKCIRNREKGAPSAEFALFFSGYHESNVDDCAVLHNLVVFYFCSATFDMNAVDILDGSCCFVNSVLGCLLPALFRTAD